MAVPALDFQLDLEADEPFADRLDAEILYRVVERALVAEGIAGSVEITLVITDDDEIRALNDAHRGIDEPTDVLSFPLEDSPLADTPLGNSPLEDSSRAGDFAESPGVPAFVSPPELARHLGDIVISFPRAEAQALEYGHSLRRELAYLTVHGCLHLLGYDHDDEAEREVMRGKEEAALAEVSREGG
jgi:probable rRNA maturation factor